MGVRPEIWGINFRGRRGLIIGISQQYLWRKRFSWKLVVHQLLPLVNTVLLIWTHTFWRSHFQHLSPWIHSKRPAEDKRRQSDLVVRWWTWNTDLLPPDSNPRPWPLELVTRQSRTNCVLCAISDVYISFTITLVVVDVTNDVKQTIQK